MPISLARVVSALLSLRSNSEFDVPGLDPRSIFSICQYGKAPGRVG